ncbi:MAG: hypothetical protein AAGH15_13580 [Myxococcota bacterium]
MSISQRLLVLVALAFACGDDAGGAGVRDPGAGADADAGMADVDMGAEFSDAGADGGTTAGDMGAPPGTLFQGLDAAGRFAAEDSALGSLLTCFDELGERNAEVDCADPRCAALPSCCIGDGTCCAPLGEPRELRFDCEGELGACVRDAGFEARPFGSPEPFLDAGGLAPGGDGTYDSGLVLADTLDATGEALVLSLEFAAASECGRACRETVAAGFAPAPFAAGNQTHVEPLAALRHVGSRDELVFLVAGEVAGVFAREEGAYALTLRPTGEIEARAPSGATLDATLGTPGPVALVVWGHSRNPSAGPNPGDRLTSLTLTREACDVPGAWSERAARDEMLSDALRSVSVDLDGSRQLVAALVDESGLQALESTDAGLEPLRAPPAGLVALPEGFVQGDGAAVIADPTGIGALWVALEDADARSAIVRAPRVRGGDANEPPFDARAFELAFIAEAHGLGRLGRFDVVETAEVAVLVVEAPERSTGLALFLRGTGVPEARADGWREFGGGLEAALAGSSLGTLRHPSLVSHGGSWRLHLEARRNGRSRVVILASDTLAAWRLVDAETLGPSGAGFDRFGTRAPSAAGAGDALVVCYAGDDGIRQRLGCARRTASSVAALTRSGS